MPPMQMAPTIRVSLYKCIKVAATMTSLHLKLTNMHLIHTDLVDTV